MTTNDFGRVPDGTGREKVLIFGGLHSIDFAERTVTIKADSIPPLRAGRYVIADQQGLADLSAELARVRKYYGELLYEVSRKFPGETRHETALRYIREREAGTSSLASGIAQKGQP